MNNNNKKEKRRMNPAILIIFVIIGIIALLPVIISLFVALLPIFLFVSALGLLGLLVFALIKLIRKSKKAEIITPQEEKPYTTSPQQPDNEITLIKTAFGLLQRRITEQLALEYPGARWVWSAPNAIERFKSNEPLIVLLNSAGGYGKAQVGVHNLIFTGMKYFTLESQNVPLIIPAETNNADDTDEIDESENLSDDSENDNISDDLPVNYGRLAFEWVDANIEDINTKYNEAIAQTQTEMLIPAVDLPHPDSWTDLCEELKRNGFSVAEFCEDGIKVNIKE